MVQNSPYRAAYTRLESRLHLGYDYSRTIIINTTSNQMQGISPVMDTFLADVNSVMYNLIENVKQIKIFRSFAVWKYENEFN